MAKRSRINPADGVRSTKNRHRRNLRRSPETDIYHYWRGLGFDIHDLTADDNDDCPRCGHANSDHDDHSRCHHAPDNISTTCPCPCGWNIRKYGP